MRPMMYLRLGARNPCAGRSVVKGPKPRVGISSCLLGEEVRWDGGHKRHPFLADVLGSRVEWVRVCPEVEIGLGVPRESIAFVGAGRGLRLVGAESRRDLTDTMRAWAEEKAAALAGAGLCGWVLKARSPSCGLGGARVYESLAELRADGAFERGPRGLFAEALVAAHPRLPVVEEGALDDRAGREHFVERIFAHRRLREMGDLAGFHVRHELQIVSHTAEGRRTLAALAAEGRREEYAAAFADALAVPPTRERHVGTLRRAWNRLEGGLGEAARRAIEAAIRSYGEGQGELDSPRALLAAAAREIGDAVLAGQTYLEPDLLELEIRALA
jgi:uncharacterized protein YbbK (DUF523 family)/uncharacterized protein YbgA (DUF1722 family)